MQYGSGEVDPLTPAGGRAQCSVAEERPAYLSTIDSPCDGPSIHSLLPRPGPASILMPWGSFSHWLTLARVSSHSNGSSWMEQNQPSLLS